MAIEILSLIFKQNNCNEFRNTSILFIFRPEPSLALGAVAVSSDDSDSSTSAWLIPLVICFVISLCLLATAMLFYVKCYGTPNRAPKTTLINFSNSRAQFIPSFGRTYTSNNSTKKKIQENRRSNRLEMDPNCSQPRCQQFGNNNEFPRAELQLLPTSSDSNFAGSSEMRQSTLDQNDSAGRIEEAKRLSQRC